MPWNEVSVMDQRHEFVRLALQEGANRRELCRRFNISPDVGYKWLARWKAGDRELVDRSRRPHAMPKRSDTAFLARNARSLTPYLLVAAPFVLLPVWLSVRTGLRPLQQLARRIAQRGQDDLQPVGFDARHRELQPAADGGDGPAPARLQPGQPRHRAA